MGWKKFGWKAGAIGVVIFLIALINAIGYIGNALTDPKNQWIWWGITAIVGVTTGMVEILERR